MPQIFLGILALVIALWALNVVSKVDPKIAARVTKAGGGLLALGFAIFLGLRGEIGVALPLGVFGLGLLGWVPFGVSGFSRTGKSAGQVSRVRSRFFEMELDHDSGEMRGWFLDGKYAGTALEAIDCAALISILPDLDEESRALLEAYLDRRQPGWREDVDEDAGAGSGQAPRHSPMTEEEACQILGIEPGASAVEIGRAHRSLMKKLHPDQGGSTYLAARVNEAKEILLRRHR